MKTPRGLLCGECLLRGISIPSRGSVREGVLYEMVRHERTIEADKWVLGIKVALSTMAGQTWEKASELAVSIRHELMASLDHITPSLDYTIAKAREQLKKGTQKDPRADAVASWTDESPMPTMPEKKK